jgi:YihY family inner membrane protein
VINYIATQLPVARDLISTNIDLAVRSRGVIGIIGLLILLWSATGIFSSLTTAMNRAWGFPNDRFIVWQKLLEIGLALAVGAALILSLLVTTILQYVSIATGIAPLADELQTSITARVVLGLTPLIFDFLAFLVLFRVLPSRKVHMRDLWLPALIGALLFEILKNVFSWYIATFTNYQLVFGSLAALVVFLFWIYLSALIILFCTQLAAMYARLRNPAYTQLGIIGGTLPMSVPQPERMSSAENPPTTIVTPVDIVPEASEQRLPDPNVSEANVPEPLKANRQPITIGLLTLLVALLALITFLNLRKVGAAPKP